MARTAGIGASRAGHPDGARRRSEAAAEAIARFLDAVVPPAERGLAELAGTPQRVAEAWLTDLLDGYAGDAGAILAEAMPSRGRASAPAAAWSCGCGNC